jgi:hypothetical protein
MKRRKEHVVSILILTALYLLTAVEAFSTTVPYLQPRIPSLRRPLSSLHMAVEHRKRRLAKNAKKVASIPKQAAKIYADYAQRLWQETNSDARSLIAKDRASAAIKAVEHMMKGEEYLEFEDNPETQECRQKLLDACQDMLQVLQLAEKTKALLNDTSTRHVEVASVESSSSSELIPAKKASRSVWFGAAMGAVVACWVFSGNWIFTGIFTLMTILGQLEYYRMVMNTGIYPARRISVIGASSMFLTVRGVCSLFNVTLLCP